MAQSTVSVNALHTTVTNADGVGSGDKIDNLPVPIVPPVIGNLPVPVLRPANPAGSGDTLPIWVIGENDRGLGTLPLPGGSKKVVVIVDSDTSNDKASSESSGDSGVIERADHEKHSDRKDSGNTGGSDTTKPGITVDVTSPGTKGVIGKPSFNPEAIPAGVCATVNQCSVGTTLKALHQDSKWNTDLRKALNIIEQDGQYEKLNALTGKAYASTRTALLGNHGLRNVVQSRVSGLHADRLASAQPVFTASSAATPVSSAMLHAPASQVWANTWGYDGQTSGSRNTAQVNQRGQGVAAGVDTRIANNLSAGVLAGFEDGKVTSGGVRQSAINVKSVSLGAYASGQAGDIALQGGLIYSHLDIDGKRDLTALGLGEAKASYKGYKVQAFVEGSRAFDVNDAATVSPYVNLTQTWLHTDEAKESGSAAALVSAAQNDSVFQSTLGVRASYRLPTETPVLVTANLGWAHAFGDTAAKTSNRFAGTSNRFVIEGNRMDRDRALVGLGVEANVAKNATLAVNYDGQFGSKDKNHAGSLKFKLRF